MKSDAYQEFLQANSRRNYPFVEDASLWDDGASFELPISALLNFRGLTRQEPEDAVVPVQLAGLVGPAAASLPGPFESDAAGWTLVFRLGTKNQETGTPQYLRVVIDLNINDNAALHASLVGFVPSAFGQDQPAGDMANNGLTRHPVSGTADDYDYLAAMIHVSVSDDIIGMLPVDDTSRLYFSGALIEPSLFANLWRTEIERLVIEDPCWTAADVRGGVTIREGYNMEIVRLDNSLLISPSRYAGMGVQSIIEFREWICEPDTDPFAGYLTLGGLELIEGGDLVTLGGPIPDPEGSLTPEELFQLSLLEPCRGNILRVNGLGPDDNNEFKIFGSNGITIKNFPNDHLIVINANIPQQVTLCPDPE